MIKVTVIGIAFKNIPLGFFLFFFFVNLGERIRMLSDVWKGFKKDFDSSKSP